MYTHLVVMCVIVSNTPPLPTHTQASKTAQFVLGMLFNNTLVLPTNSTGNSTVQIRLSDEVLWTDVRTRTNFTANATTSLLTLTNLTEGVQTLEARAVKSDGLVDVTPLVRVVVADGPVGLCICTPPPRIPVTVSCLPLCTRAHPLLSTSMCSALPMGIGRDSTRGDDNHWATRLEPCSSRLRQLLVRCL